MTNPLRPLRLVRRGRGRGLPAAVLLVGLAVAAVGCGDSDDGEGTEQSAAEAWADDLCASAGDWKAEVDAARDALSEPANLSVETVESTFDDLREATSAFVDELGGLGAPDTEAGDEAEAQLSAFADTVEEQQAVIADATERSADSAQDLVAQAADVTGAISVLLGDLNAFVDEISQLDGAQELTESFETSSSCQELRADG